MDQTLQLEMALYATAKGIQQSMNLIENLLECETYTDLILYCSENGITLPEDMELREAQNIIQRGILMGLDSFARKLLDKFPGERSDSYKWN